LADQRVSRRLRQLTD